MKKRINLEIPSEQYELLKAYADSKGKSFSQLLLDVILAVIPENEAWLYDPKNSVALEKLQNGLNQEGMRDWEAIKKRLKL